VSRVDVVVPCYKYGHYLRGCVESVLAQPGVDVRVLILDDASPDQTPEVAAELTARDRRVEYRRHATNQGHIATYNEGLLGWADGDYSLLLSADDLLAPGALARATRLMDEHPSVGMTYGLSVVLEGDGVPQDGPTPAEGYECQVLESSRFLEYACTTRCNPVPTPTAVVRTKVQKKVGGYRKELPHTGDLEMWLRFAVHGAVGVVGVNQAYYRRHRENMTYQYHRPVLADLKEYRDAFESLFREYGGAVPAAHRLREAATRGIAEDAFWRASRAFDGGDWSAGRECLAFARSTWPAIRSTGAWSRFRLKRLLGPKLWSALSPVVTCWRGRSTSEGHPKPNGRNRIIGWWPTDRAAGKYVVAEVR
jgi:glycosyltransferase involved in cell wall biosynthesis